MRTEGVETPLPHTQILILRSGAQHRVSKDGRENRSREKK